MCITLYLNVWYLHPMHFIYILTISDNPLVPSSESYHISLSSDASDTFPIFTKLPTFCVLVHIMINRHSYINIHMSGYGCRFLSYQSTDCLIDANEGEHELVPIFVLMNHYSLGGDFVSSQTNVFLNNSIDFKKLAYSLGRNFFQIIV